MENVKQQEPIRNALEQLGVGRTVLLGAQHAFTMFGATVLVPILTGLDVSVSLFMAGVCTLIGHLIMKNRIPVFLGSSFAFIAPIGAAVALANANGIENGLPYAAGGIVVAGLIYAIVALLIYFFGSEKIVSFFPPIVTGPIIMVIGLKLAPNAISMASENWFLAIVAFIVVVAVNVFAKGFLQIIPVVTGLIAGYVVAIITKNVDFAPIVQAQWLGLPNFTIAKFDFQYIMVIAPVALATIVEHIGDIIAIGATVDDDFTKDPGLHRTMLADGLMTSLSAFVGGPANTTYSENTGVLALTRVWDPLVMKIAAVFAIILGGVPKIAAVIASIPQAVIGGISIVLFGMIASIGLRTVVEHQVDFTKSRNLIIAATILVLGLGGAVVPLNIGSVHFSIEGMALAAIVGIIMNKILPQDR
ncbi:solute carrier family 23 protein [Proteiniborus sp. MB09-C3]|uniref:uracil-xanthine permease family protein n=1 Tax=Proteiniborus sp. MB09-C3 TaxID=3050072 RepID=UPI0025527E7E|nr:solute carrier family 23 protein [Proteiniborus sp. MB09-C3]WIV11690.1 solute carrier family 23 protein [Proteiniborus sp. MB09-C3]